MFKVLSKSRVLRLIKIATVVMLHGCFLAAAPVIMGDITTPLAQQSFSFPLGASVYHGGQGLLYVGAGQALTGTTAQYALSIASSLGGEFVPLVGAAQITFNSIPDQANPLLGAQVSLLSLLGQQPVVVIANDQSSVYLVVENNPLKVVSASGMQDATGAVTTGIVALGTNGAVDDVIALESGMAVFAAVKKNGGVFGQVGGGIAVDTLIADQTTTDKQPGKLIFKYAGTAPFDPTTPALYITTPLAAIAPNQAVLHCNVPLPTLYVGVQSTAAAGVGSGAFSIAAAGCGPLVPTFTKMAPDASVAADSIIATNTPSQQVTAYYIKTMKTTMLLWYLIVCGGVGDPTTVKRKVFALPLLSSTGLLAQKNAVPVTEFLATDPHVLVGRYLVTPPAVAGDLFTSTDTQALVGGGDLPGDATALFVGHDAVFASVGVSDTNFQAGVFYSQALFDSVGRVKGWTNWQRVSGNALLTWGSYFDNRLGNFWLLTGTDASTVTTVQRTSWGNQKTNLAFTAGNYITKPEGGVQGLSDFAYSNTAFSQVPGQRLAVTLMTGYQKVIIAQTGSDNGSLLFGPQLAANPLFDSSDGTLAGFSSGVNTLQMTGGALSQLGAITSAAVVSDGVYGWFVVGGTGGVAVLAHADGTGWPIGLQSGFVGLDATMSWKKIGNYAAVRKVIGDSGNLYILTQKSLQSMQVSAGNFAQASPVSSVLAQAGELPNGLNSFLSDVQVSGSFAVLATSSGLLRVGNNANITTATNSGQVGWVFVTLPESVGPVTRLLPISTTGVAQDFATAGNLYVVNACVSRDQTRIYRFTVDLSGTITDTTLTQLPDYFIQGYQSFFINIGEYRNFLTFDGSIFALSRSRYKDEPLFFELLGPTWVKRTGVSAVKNAIKVVNEPTSFSVGGTIRSSASGAWLVPGDFGLIVNE